MSTVPVTIGGGRVLWVSPIDERHHRTNACRHLYPSGPMPVADLLAICERSEGFFLCYCDNEWNLLTDTWHRSEEQAKAQAEFEFAGVGQTWLRPGK
jgi:hypothetical protein